MSGQLDEIQAKIFEIGYLRSKLEKDLHQKRQELLQLAVRFNTYQELYTYTRKTAQSQEEFNSMMFTARDLFLDK